MKKALVSLTVIAILAIGGAVYGQGPGWVGNYSCPGYGYHMMWPNYGGSMGWRGGRYDQKYLDETANVRKELNTKQFEYSEAIRNSETNPKTIAKLEQEIGELQNKLYANAPKETYRGFNMPCWQF